MRLHILWPHPRQPRRATVDMQRLYTLEASGWKTALSVGYLNVVSNTWTGREKNGYKCVCVCMYSSALEGLRVSVPG